MRTVDENITTLSRVILSDARGEAEAVLAEAREKAEAIRQRAREQAAAERKQILERAAREAERIRSQAVATTQLKARTRLLEHREKLLNEVFAAAREQLPAVQEWKEYPGIALGLLREAVSQLRGSAITVRADKATHKLLTEKVLKDAAREAGVAVKTGRPLEKGIGVIAETADGHLNYDNTLETRLNRMQNSIRSGVHHLLMGEKS